MARNRRNQSLERFVPVLKAFLLCTLIGGAGLGYVWKKSETVEFGRKLGALEKKLKRQQQQNKDLNDTYASLCTPQVLQEKIARWKLDLAMPAQEQIVHLPPPGSGAAPAGARLPSSVQMVAQQEVARGGR